MSGARERSGAVRGAAFFDVDETLITAKSMFEFLRFWLARGGDDGTRYARHAAALRDMSALGIPREEVNRAYYQYFAGTYAADVRAAGRDWYAAYRERPDAFVTAGLSALARHRAAGDTVVLVSGSFRACLDPLAEDLAADRVLCGQLVVDERGFHTGEVVEPMIGRAKADAVAKTMRELGLAAGDCCGYGDHASDLDMLRVVGRPSVIGDDPTLGELARTHGWPVMSSAHGARGEE
ncbi:HAD-IB family hydrolase [Streptomyces sp. NPDC005402]|uniref:HAD family hydrolase n=1 Tax=Streptomyces sp. NPDC005402 TaxID=3155338 RepID=UPI0033A62B41